MTSTMPHPGPVAALPETRPPQYSLGQIAAVWAAAALPMGLLAWIVAPWAADRIGGPTALTEALLACLAIGCAWQFLLVVVLVAREQRSLRWSRVREALWLRAPRSPRTGLRGGRLWLILIPLVLLFALEELVPAFPHPIPRDFGLFLDSSAGEDFLSGAWGWFAVIVALTVFNTVLGDLKFGSKGDISDDGYVINGVKKDRYVLYVWRKGPDGRITYFEAEE